MPLCNASIGLFCVITNPALLRSYEGKSLVLILNLHNSSQMQVCQINSVSNMQKMLSQLNTKLNTVKYKALHSGR